MYIDKEDNVWLTEKPFETALKLAHASQNGKLGWLGALELGEIDTYHQAIRRLKRALAAGGVDPGTLVENNKAKQYRFSVPARNVTVDEDVTASHSP